MLINRLIIENVRNIRHVELDNFGLLNIFVGKNGSGKTSLLESISLLSIGRSFRSNKVSTVISHKADILQLFCQLEASQDKIYHIGLARSRQGGFSVRINGENLKSLAPLSQILPTLLFNNTSFLLLEGGASYRSQFVDWGVFHVEHHFHQVWQSHKRNLKQRNSLLKNKNLTYSELEPWDKGLLTAAVDIENLRITYLKGYVQSFISLCKKYQFKEVDNLSFYYHDGWSIGKHLINKDIGSTLSYPILATKLKNNFDRDKRMQRTHAHSGKSDLLILASDELARDVLSRGQMKKLIILLKLAQAQYLTDVTNKKPILLFDDLSSELDIDNLTFIINVLHAEQLQSFISVTDSALFREHEDIATKVQMFHVKHGKIGII